MLRGLMTWTTAFPAGRTTSANGTLSETALKKRSNVSRSRTMSRWNHSICWDCWSKRETVPTGEIRRPVRVVTDDLQYLNARCCYCSRRTIAGIFKRENPRDVPCNGDHPEALKIF